MKYRINKFRSDFNKLDEESKVLFPESISNKVHEFYIAIDNCIKTISLYGFSISDDDQIKKYRNSNFKTSIDKIFDCLDACQQQVKDGKLDNGLRRAFEKYLKLKDDE